MVPPVCQFLLPSFGRCLKRSINQQRCCPKAYPDADETKCKTIYDYKALYQGPELNIQLAYGQMWILCTIAFVFGCVIPMLFVVALAGLAILYLNLRLRIAYSVKRVPTFDHNANMGFILCLSSLALIYALGAAH